MDWFLAIASIGGMGAIALAFVVWRLIKRSNQVEVLQDDQKEKDILVAGLQQAKRVRERLDADPAYAKRVRDTFTRHN